MAKPNYGQMKKQKEAARKARQQAKADRRQARVAGSTEDAPEAAADTAPLASTGLPKP
jgi:hypothetical protein